MPTLSKATIERLILPYFPAPTEHLLLQLSLYLDLLLRWNARTNLTAIRDPEEIVTRHFGESLFAARHVPPSATTLLDLGSGAGFPGLPIQLVHPAINVTLAESQNKKAAFLLEAKRVLGVSYTVWASRCEDLPATTKFDVVALRAVDDPTRALVQAFARLSPGGTLLHLTGRSKEPSFPAHEGLELPHSGTILRVTRQP